MPLVFTARFHIPFLSPYICTRHWKLSIGFDWQWLHLFKDSSVSITQACSLPAPLLWWIMLPLSFTLPSNFPILHQDRSGLTDEGKGQTTSYNKQMWGWRWPWTNLTRGTLFFFFRPSCPEVKQCHLLHTSHVFAVELVSAVWNVNSLYIICTVCRV